MLLERQDVLHLLSVLAEVSSAAPGAFWFALIIKLSSQPEHINQRKYNSFVNSE